MKKNVIKHGCGKSLMPAGLRRKLLPVLIAGCFGAGHVWANPTGAQVVNGQVSIASQGNVLTVTNSPGAIINWQSFSIGQGELTRFVQQGASSTVLNRIVGQDPSQILGALQSNGRVFLINPNGILFGQGAQVNVAGLVASTLNISNEDFLAGRMKFQAGDKAGNLQNQGSITTPNGGQIYLVAPNVENSGILTSPKGEVVLAAGQSVHLVDSANPDLHVVVSAPENQALNLGQVVAESGKIGVYGALIKQRGLVSADSAVVGENGKIVFKASKDALLEAGSRTSATGAGTGGTVHVLGERVGLSGDAKIDVSGQTGGGTALVGGDYQGQNAEVTNARQTYFGRDAEIRADATAQGNGGKVILWADETTRAYGNISARGGEQGGNGGFVEVSGKQNLAFDARVDTRAPKGSAGMTLLDPDTLTIVNGNGGADDTAYSSANGSIVWDVPPGADYTVSEAALESMSATSHVTLQANGDIRLQNLADNELSFAQVAGYTVAFDSRNGNIVFMDSNDRIVTNGGHVTMWAGAGGINIGGITTKGGDVSLFANGGDLTTGVIDTSSNIGNGGSVNFNSTGNMAVGAINTSSATNYGGAIDLNSGGGMALGSIGNIDAYGGEGRGNVTLYSYGDIKLLNGNKIRSLKLELNAENGIHDGAGGAMNVDISILNATNWSSGDIRIRNGNTSTLVVDPESSGLAQYAPGGNISLETAGDLTISRNVYTSGGNIDLRSGGLLTNEAMITTTGLSSGGSEGIDMPPSVPSTVGGSISLTASKMMLRRPVDHDSGMEVARPINAGNGKVTLASTAGTAIHLGTSSELDYAVGALELSADELSQINASRLIVGSGTSGDITIMSSLLSSEGGTLEGITSGLVLKSAGSITQQAGALIGTSALEAVGSSVNLMEANHTGVVSGKATTGDFQYHTINHLAVSTVQDVAGIHAKNAVRLVSDSNASISQNSGSSISAVQLALQTPGAVTLNDAGNAVGMVAADTSLGGIGVGGFSMMNSGSLQVGGPIFGLSGITTNNQDVNLYVPSGFAITVLSPINAGTATIIRNEGGAITFGGAVSIPSQNPIWNQVVNNTSTNVIVNASSSIMQFVDDSSPIYSAMNMQSNQQEKRRAVDNAAEQSADQVKSGESKNDVAPKLYCN
ncbi:filamentous hemagglutinin N-terminal domain-containing protein [Paucimonas lemoignei]|nr:filamentous hemagglutinin N-terminal domain-containing protein [Paucimonas lemoignei]